MTISASQIAKINKMNKASQTPSLGTVVAALQNGAVVSGSITVNATHTNGSAVVINSGLGTIKGHIVQVYKSGSSIYGHYVSNASGSITIMANASGSYLLTAGDNIEYIVW